MTNNNLYDAWLKNCPDKLKTRNAPSIFSHIIFIWGCPFAIKIGSFFIFKERSDTPYSSAGGQALTTILWRYSLLKDIEHCFDAVKDGTIGFFEMSKDNFDKIIERLEFNKKDKELGTIVKIIGDPKIIEHIFTEEINFFHAKAKRARNNYMLQQWRQYERDACKTLRYLINNQCSLEEKLVEDIVNLLA